MGRMRWGQLARALCVAIVVVVAAGSAQAVQRMYKGELKFGFGDGNLGVEPSPMGGTEAVDTANNAIPPCAAPGAVVTPSGMGSAPPVTPSGAGPQTGTLDFWGLADVATTGGGAIDPAQRIEFAAVAPTQAGFANWGLVANCPKYTNGVPGGLLFRRTQMAAFDWPNTTGTVRPGGGLGLPGGTTGGVPTGGLTATQALVQRIRQIQGPNKYGGSIGIVGRGDTLLGIEGITAVGLPSAIGSLPILINVGLNGGSTPGGSIIPTGSVSTMSVTFKIVTDPSQRQPNGPVPPTTAPTYPLLAFNSGLGFPWTTGIVTAYDNIGDFRTTRTRTGVPLAVAGAPTGGGGTSASLQMVAPAILRLGIEGLTTLGIAVTAVMDIRFVPEPSSVAMLGAGVGMVGLLFVRQRRRARVNKR